MKDFIFVNEGRAILPMNRAIQESYQGRFRFHDMTFEKARAYEGIRDAIVWMNMGFYYKKMPAKVIIHDYRSLSVGRGAKIKDFLKKNLVPKPHFRVSKPEIDSVMKFNDGVKTFFIDIAAKDSILNFRNLAVDSVYDYCYIGVINKERGVEKIIQRFLDQTSNKTIIMIGAVEDDIDKEFAGNDRIKFTGRVPQEQVFSYIKQSDVCLAYFPNKYPHNRQTPTKLLEYACLGSRILINEQPMNVSISEKYAINAVVRNDARLFDSLPDLPSWKDNMEVDPTPMLFSTHLRESGLGALLDGQA
ncbi:hypothetical protein [Ancylobacter sp. G4_0304]|uniref:hypothetical protein n=1 Tax=Ancylobacter sp. G4_0304 TaxID=3114289 RepID=UPI0039C62356